MKKKILESSIENPVVNYARSLGVLCVKQTHRGAPSHPDRAFYFGTGLLLQIEFKKTGGLPTPLQASTILDLRERRFPVFLVDDKSTGMCLVRAFYQGTHESDVVVAAADESTGITCREVLKKHLTKSDAKKTKKAKNKRGTQ